MNLAIFLFCAVLMILGITELCRLLVFWWTKPLTKDGLSIVVRPKNAEECECVLRAAVERARWLDFKGPCEILCLNPGGDPEISKTCRLLSLYYPAVRMLGRREITQYEGSADLQGVPHDV